MKRSVCRTAYAVLVMIAALASCIDGGGAGASRRQERLDSDWIRQNAALPRSGSDDPRDWNVYVEVQNLQADSAGLDFGQISWVYRGADATVGGGGGPILANNGIRIGIARGRLAMGAIAGSSNTHSRQTTTQFVTVLNGQTASLDVGNVYTEPMTIFIMDHRRTVVGTHCFVKAGASLEVRPTIVGDDMLDIEVMPVITSYDRGARRLALQELRTRVRVRDGQSLVIGGQETSQSTFGNTLFSKTSTHSSSQRVVVLTPTILK
ncbi:MAG: hypothetical protein RDV41_08665 [Planctomycetota bacterium]|nr:hypothetical protein [Planctomycetota bacterium]